MVQQTIGTPCKIDARDAILFLEETHDPMSVADERLVHLRAAGLLRGVKGIVFGQLSLDRSEEDEFEDFLLDLVSDLEVPILMDFPPTTRSRISPFPLRNRSGAGRRRNDGLAVLQRGRSRSPRRDRDSVWCNAQSPPSCKCRMDSKAPDREGIRYTSWISCSFLAQHFRTA